MIVQTLLENSSTRFTNLYDVRFSPAEGVDPSKDLTVGGLTVGGSLDTRGEEVSIGGMAIEPYFSPALKTHSPTGFTGIKEVTISLRENPKGEVFKYLDETYKNIFDRNTLRMIKGLPGRKDITIITYGDDVVPYPGQNGGLATSFSNPITFILKNCILQNLPLPQFSWKDSKAIVYSVKFTVDKVEIKYS